MHNAKETYEKTIFNNMQYIKKGDFRGAVCSNSKTLERIFNAFIPF